MKNNIIQDNAAQNSKGERSLTVVEDMLGRNIARRLVECFPGTQIYIPKKLSENHELLALGEFEAKELVKYFGGDTLNIAMNLLTSAERYNLIAKQINDGNNANQIALNAGCTRRRVFQIKAELQTANDNANPAQTNLFD